MTRTPFAPAALAATAALAVAAALAGCQEGDWLGPLERGARSAFNGWDMWDAESVRAYEGSLPPTPAGVVPRRGPEGGYALGCEGFERIPLDARAERAATAYRRYCHHCHGPNGDGRVIVGESLDIPPADLRSLRVQAMSDEEIHRHLVSGGELMVPLEQTICPTGMRLVIEHVRTLEGAPSAPYYRPQSTAPLE